MMYREYLVMRKPLAWFACIVLAIEALGFLLSPKSYTKVDYGSIAMSAGVFSSFFAWIFGVALGNGSREAARVLWVLPGERWKLALQVIAVDLLGATVAFAYCYMVQLGFLALADLRFSVNIPSTVTAADIVLPLALVYAVYGWSTLVGMLGRRMPYCGVISAPALVIWFTLAQSPTAMGAILRAPIIANPIAVFNTAMALESWQRYRYSVDAVSASLQWLGTTWEAPVLVAITVLTCGFAVMLWQRAEVISA